MIKIKDIRQPVGGLFNDTDEFIGSITNNLQMLDVLVQIKEQKVEGYYVIFNENKMEISPTGRMKAIPGWMDQEEKLLKQLMGF